MIEERLYCASVRMGNKLFVIGGHNKTSCEVFDSLSRKLTLLKGVGVRMTQRQNDTVCHYGTVRHFGTECLFNTATK